MVKGVYVFQFNIAELYQICQNKGYHSCTISLVKIFQNCLLILKNKELNHIHNFQKSCPFVEKMTQFFPDNS